MVWPSVSLNEKRGNNKMLIKELLKRIVHGKKYDSRTYIDYLRSLGMIIGEDCAIYVPTKTSIDETRPWLISLGNCHGTRKLRNSCPVKNTVPHAVNHKKSPPLRGKRVLIPELPLWFCHQLPWHLLQSSV